jgi:hypothetical protein
MSLSARSDDPVSTALNLLTIGDASGAARVIEALPAARSLERAPMHLLALAKAHLGRYEPALFLYRRLAAEDPANPDLLLQHGTCLLAIERFSERAWPRPGSLAPTRRRRA